MKRLANGFTFVAMVLLLFITANAINSLIGGAPSRGDKRGGPVFISHLWHRDPRLSSHRCTQRSFLSYRVVLKEPRLGLK